MKMAVQNHWKSDGTYLEPSDGTEGIRISATQIDVKVPLNTGTWSFPEDAGVVTANAAQITPN